MNMRLDLKTLVRLRQAAGAQAGKAPAGDGRLQEVVSFGANPGGLRMLAHVPADLPRGAPLVVALHGCTQTAGGFDLGCGWSDMAERSGFALLMPEQRRTNNAHLCFNWFEPGDTGRDMGEAASIRQMIGWMLREHGLDPARVFITGLSAGGAMTSVMLATYPEVFAAGAVVAGLPHGAASGVGEALGAMARPAALAPGLRGDAVRAASRHRGPWPRVAVWHGDADTTVHPGNADEIAKQWLDLHGLADAAPRRGTGEGGHELHRWAGADGTVRVALHRVAGLGHGVPLSPGREEGRCGQAGAYLLDAGLSSTHAILDFWGLPTGGAALPEMEVIPPGAAPRPGPAKAPGAGWQGPLPQADSGPGAVITKALRAAGLMGR
ncbi:PHB depolymerase family esterase [Roseomonas sp. SSH11]|uniref:PHB depolymerase family esterase n=1 Tax=Pararoseomonas baculiformis TaxID=2820812 RepID=A0ABS4AGC1_9PROT|nr:PHB depolymerase family esterase [Pararoseomonas baculiformis]MBP0445909.1 PHB depolymerase family esterase [Pararoseomonas baculiformis]